MSHVFMTFRVASRAEFKCFQVFVGGATELNFAIFSLYTFAFTCMQNFADFSLCSGDQNGVRTCGGTIKRKHLNTNWVFHSGDSRSRAGPITGAQSLINNIKE